VRRWNARGERLCPTCLGGMRSYPLCQPAHAAMHVICERGHVWDIYGGRELEPCPRPCAAQARHRILEGWWKLEERLAQYRRIERPAEVDANPDTPLAFYWQERFSPVPARGGHMTPFGGSSGVPRA
jgi:hypothetical protein